jgi:hypothetical protein
LIEFHRSTCVFDDRSIDSVEVITIDTDDPLENPTKHLLTKTRDENKRNVKVNLTDNSADQSAIVAPNRRANDTANYGIDTLPEYTPGSRNE